MSHDILIVDDELDIRSLLSGILQDEGYDTRQAANSKEAIAAINLRLPTLVILDIWLQNSDLDGLKILEWIQKSHPGCPVIMISGHGNIQTAVSAIKAGAYDFIEKPFKADKLILLVKRAIEAAEAGASCLRINPGNIGSIDRVKEVVKAAKDFGCSIRIGVNAGSLEKEILEKYGSPCPEAMVESALMHEKILKDLDFNEYKISVKASDVLLTVEAYKQLAKATKAPLHLGVTEAGGLMTGSIKSSIGIGQLLMMGIGDTIRVSLSADPVEEVRVGFNILKSLGLRYRGVTIISCPSCARQGFEVIDTVKTLEDKLSHITESITLSVIGCVVNGPGEALYTDVGFTGGGNNNGMIYLNGKQLSKIDNKDMIEKIVEHVEEKAIEIANEKKL